MIGVGQIAAWRSKWNQSYEALTEGDPESVDPRDFGLPQWWPLDKRDLEAEAIAEARGEFYGALGYDPGRLVSQIAPLE